MPSFIADGYAFSGVIKPIEGVHDGIEIEYRAMTPIESAEFVHESEQLDGKELREKQAEWLLKKIQRWQAVKTDGGIRTKIPVLNEAILCGGTKAGHIHSVLLSQLVDVVCWGSKPDEVMDSFDEESVKN